MDGEVTYADLRFPPNAGAQRGTRAKTAPGSSHWGCFRVLLGILCLLLLAVSIALGVLLLKREDSAAEIERYAASLQQMVERHNETQNTLNQTRAALRSTEEKLENWAALAGLHWYCPEGWTLANGTCYYTSLESKDWGSSLFDCFARGAHLAIIKNQTDQVFQDISEPMWVGAVTKNLISSGTIVQVSCISTTGLSR
ncbi:killer cell lectin-like receptor subfamily B member 1B allele A [Ambystoma mexicanum]|uniref:killer cell lectin-like receptor subfamily B member 1B allele A n=1 Tax=Ambystoma mexicanum TaxID=8296 RepID=UPI0037E8EFC3